MTCCIIMLKTEPPLPKTISFKYATVGMTVISPTVYSNPAITSMNGKPRLVREKNAIPLLSNPASVCMCPINSIYAVTSCQNTPNIIMDEVHLSSVIMRVLGHFLNLNFARHVVTIHFKFSNYPALRIANSF